MEILEDRYGRRSTIITSQVPVEHWHQLIGGPTYADPLWDDWEIPPCIPGIPELHLAGFDGPMDLLLDLAERQRIDLGQISILQLTEQFIAGMERLERHVALERRADWLVMATRLLLLRSRLLFSANPEDEAEAAQDSGREMQRLGELGFVQSAVTHAERATWQTNKRCRLFSETA